MIYGIEGSRQIKENKSRHFLFVNGKKEIIMNSKECCFGRVKCVEYRLKRTYRGKEMKVISESRVDDAMLYDFWDKIEIGNWSIAS